MQKSMNFLAGKIPHLIIKVTLPMILASLVTQIVQLTNIAFMGNVGDDEAYLRSLYIPFAFLIIALTEGIQISNQVSIARLKGEGKDEDIRLNINSFIILGIGISLIVLLLVVLFAPMIISYFQIPNHLEKRFMHFIYLMFLSSIFSVFFMVLTSSLRGIGKVNLSTLLVIFYALVNVGAVYYCSFVVKLGLLSIFYGNMLSTLILIVVTLMFLIRNKLLVFNRKYFKFYRKSIHYLKEVGIPISLSYIVIFVSSFFFNLIIKPFGPEAIAGFGVAYYIQTFSLVPSIAIGTALGIIMNHNIGAGKQYYPRVYNTFKTGSIYTFLFYLVISTILVFFREEIVSLMIKNESSIREAVLYLFIVAPSHLFMGLSLMTITILEQINKGVIAVLFNALYFITIIGVGWFLTLHYGESNYLYWTMTLTNGLGIIFVVAMGYIIRKEFISEVKIKRAANLS
ncbi:MATE family efflux transporter [Virgibacillus sp. C22-A2]|uniref:Probable multidrug resistance protein NorM n=1 Tax=Virgibacillus tibetensis TaxID=3042313 RepID=A0ABU6KJY2_9BACI|nr:MATE family efflux transporter [Virgibacillus sp. C22-A2]